MLLDANDPLLGHTPERFESPFPSDAALLDPKFKALLSGVDSKAPDAQTVGSKIMSQAQARAWRNAQAMCNKAKATIVGDLPSAWLPEVAYFGPVRPGVDGLRGLWADVVFKQSLDPVQFGLAVAEVGMEAALDFMGAAPIVGGLMKFIMNIGNMLGSLFSSQAPQEDKELLLPWKDYTLNSDQDIVNMLLVDKYFASVDWTAIFLPPFELGVPWTSGLGVKDGKKVGVIWAPIKGGQVAYASGGIGAMPGTYRIAGLVQSPNLPQADPRLLRYFGDGTMMHWGRALTDTGEFYPASAQTSTLAWQQAQRAGSPDMFKVDCAKIESAWREYFDQFFDSLWRVYNDDDEWVGEFAAPYLAVQGGELRLGLRDPARPKSPTLQRPHPAPLITPTIFTAGAGTPATRNKCLYLEDESGPYGKGQDAVRGFGNISSGGTLATPYKRDDRSRAVASGGPGWPASKPMPRNAVCVPWPSGEELLVTYSRPDVAFTTPAARRLAERQRWSLRHTLVSAYVRCDGPTAYAAFKADPQLANLCRDMREKLLQDPARYLVRLADVADIDPAFEKRLRKSGVNNSPSQMSQHIGRVNTEVDADAVNDPDPPAIPPAGGIPFDIGRPVRRGRDDSSIGGVAVVGTLAIALAAVAAYKLRH